MKVFLGIIGTITLIGALNFGMSGMSITSNATTIMQQQAGYLSVLCGLICLLVTVCSWSACIKTTRKDLEDLHAGLKLQFDGLKHKLEK